MWNIVCMMDRGDCACSLASQLCTVAVRCASASLRPRMCVKYSFTQKYLRVKEEAVWQAMVTAHALCFTMTISGKTLYWR